MAKVNVNEATGKVLNWMVSKALNDPSHKPWYPDPYEGFGFGPVWLFPDYDNDGALVMDIVEREGISTRRLPAGWVSSIGNAEKPSVQQCADTAKVAALRCFVASKLGDEVDVPSELLS